jgi:hypothetical protein
VVWCGGDVVWCGGDVLRRFGVMVWCVVSMVCGMKCAMWFGYNTTNP